ncbi:MAG: NADH-quinone oxidoreductase subunit J [Ignavibacteriae bacterium]|nr:NADH-quinone oxidoreductase subunit J [Ignavibacteriota bacterium]
MNLTFIFFGILGILAIGSGIVTISSKNPVTSAISLVFLFFMLAGLYLVLQAQFIAVIQVLVYAGAIMVLVIFVIMLLNLGDEEKMKEKFNTRKGAGFLLGAILLMQLAVVFMAQPFGVKKASASLNQGTIEFIGKELFSNYLFPFEAISLLLLAAIVGAIILAKRKID